MGLFVIFSELSLSLVTIVWIGDAPKRFGEACFGQPWQTFALSA